MGKRNGSKSAGKPDTGAAIVLAALKRAQSQIESLPGAKDELPEGGYPVSLSVSISGDVTVGAAKDATTVNDFTDRELLHGVMALMPADDVAEWVDEAVAKIKASRKDKAEAAAIKQAGNEVAQAADAAAKKHRLRKKRPGAKGSVSGKPSVLVNGQADVSPISITVSGDAGERDAA